MNVSFTRARAKLVLFGSRKTLQRDPLLAQFFKLMEEKRWILRLPPGSDSIHTKIFGGGGAVAQQETLADDEDEGDKLVAAKTGQKRRLIGKENGRVRVERHGHEKKAPPAKKIKIASGAKDIRILLGARPILQDLVANQL
jgi:DNA replication ATP-dependent helicase Dna2